MSAPSDVVISGLGVCSAAGIGAEALATGLAAGGAFGRPLVSALPVVLAATVPEPVPETPGFQDDRKAWLAFAALEEALADSRVLTDGTPVAPERIGVFLGTGLSSVTAAELEDDLYPHLVDGRFDRAAMARDLATDRGAPNRHLPQRVTDAFVARLGAQGPQGTSFSACAAAAQAIAEGAWAIRRGEVDVAIVGGHDSMVHPLGMLSFIVLGALSPTGCRPFDKGRDGFMIGEGAAIMVLERADRAADRGARARAVVLGAGTSADAWNPTAPHPAGAGAERAMRRALRDAGVAASDVDYVNAHGTGTPLGDAAETGAIGRLFGDRVWVSSIKGAIGHTIAAAGAIEAAACVLGLEGGWLPGTAGLSEPDPALPVRALTSPVRMQANVVVSNSFGFGGQNCALVLGRAPSGESSG